MQYEYVPNITIKQGRILLGTPFGTLAGMLAPTLADILLACGRFPRHFFGCFAFQAFFEFKTESSMILNRFLPSPLIRIVLTCFVVQMPLTLDVRILKTRGPRS